MIVPINKELLSKTLNEKKRAWIVGTYGMGKSLVAEWVAGDAISAGDEVLRVTFKDLPAPTSEDIPTIVGYKSYASWHAEWRRRAEAAKERGRKLYIFIEEAELTLQSGAKFWEVILSLSYYHEDTIYLLVTAMPRILASKTMALARLMRGSVLYPRVLTIEEISSVVLQHEQQLGYRLMPYLASIKNLSGCHYGTVKYLCQLIAENNYDGQKITSTKVISWARDRGDMEYFLNYVWAGLSYQQQTVVRRWVVARGKGIRQGNKQVQELVVTGLWFLGGHQIKWRIPWVVSFVREYVAQLGDEALSIGEEELTVLGLKERRLLEFLTKNIGRVVTYDELGEQVYLESKSEFSLWALSQLVSRVRGKLSELGKSELLVTVRGVGYQWG